MLEVHDLDANVFYHDDGDAVGTIPQLQQVVDIVKREGPPRGLILSTATSVLPPSQPKSKVWSPSAIGPGNPDPLQRGIPRVAEQGIIVLGSPLGSPAFVEAALQAKVQKVRDITEALMQSHGKPLAASLGVPSQTRSGVRQSCPSPWEVWV